MATSISFGLSNITCQSDAAAPRPADEIYAEMLDLAEEADRLGFDSVWCAEHHFLADGYLPSPLVFLAAVAGRTKRIALGTSILQSPLYNTLRLAEDSAVLDVISGGRFILGIGQGWRAEEFEALRIPLRGRHHLFERQIRELRRAWRHETAADDPCTADGRNVAVYPKPTHPGAPALYLGASTEAAVRRAGRVGDGLLASGVGVHQTLGLGPALTPGRLRQYIDWTRDELDARDPGLEEFTICVSLPTLVFDDDAVWERAKQHHWSVAWGYPQMALHLSGAPVPSAPEIPPAAEDELLRTCMVGSPGLIAERIARLADVVDGRFEFHARMIAPGLPAELVRESMRRFSAEVIPAFRVGVF